MDRLPPPSVPQIEQELWGTIFEQRGVVLDMLVYDTTNLFNYLAEQTPQKLGKKKA